MVHERYAKWIADDIEANNGHVRGRCHGASMRMVEAFPKLRLVRGYVHLADGFTPAHWWCETVYGVVVDPTATQFEGIVSYDEYNEAKHGPLPIGKCMDCGSLVYTATSGGFCDEDCWRAFDAYMQRERRERGYQ